MRRTAILEATRPPRRRLLLPGSRRQNVRPTRNGLGFMRKFGEYVFLEDSRYARQAKSARALPLGASARPGVTRMRLVFRPLSARAPAPQNNSGCLLPPPPPSAAPPLNHSALRLPH